MNHIAAVEEQLVSERLRRKLNEVNLAAQTQLSGVQDHVNFTLQVSLPTLYLYILFLPFLFPPLFGCWEIRSQDKKVKVVDTRLYLAAERNFSLMEPGILDTQTYSSTQLGSLRWFFFVVFKENFPRFGILLLVR